MDYASIEDLQAWARARMQRAPDFVIGDPDKPYLRRWWLLPRNDGCNIYLHEILRGDDDRAGHDHPWDNTSMIIEGGYTEITFDPVEPWRDDRRYERQAGDTIQRKATDTHRLIVPEGGRCVSLFMTGRKLREWGFWCPDGRGWVHWRDFTAGEHGELVGRGCADELAAIRGEG